MMAGHLVTLQEERILHRPVDQISIVLYFVGCCLLANFVCMAIIF